MYFVKDNFVYVFLKDMYYAFNSFEIIKNTKYENPLIYTLIYLDIPLF